MIDTVILVGRFLAGQPVENLLRLLPWHLSLLLFVLGLLAAYGLHFLIGHVLGFYRRKARHAYWISLPTALVLLAAVQLLIGAYLLGTRAPELATLNMSERLDGRLGEMLLAPAFTMPPLSAQPEDAVGGAALRAALASSIQDDYRGRLLALSEGPPATLVADSGGAPPQSPLPPGHVPIPSAPGQPGGEQDMGSPVPGLNPNEWLVARMGLRWVAAPHGTWLAPLGPQAGPEPESNDQEETQTSQGEGEQGGQGDYFLPEFLLGLINEIPPEATLSRQDWEHVAGTRFVGGYMEPLLVEYLSYLALALAVAVGLVLLAYFLIMRRLRRIGLSKPDATGAPAPAPGVVSKQAASKEKAPPVPADPPAITPSTTPSTTESTPAPAPSSPEKTPDSGRDLSASGDPVIPETPSSEAPAAEKAVSPPPMPEPKSESTFSKLKSKLW